MIILYLTEEGFIVSEEKTIVEDNVIHEDIAAKEKLELAPKNTNNTEFSREQWILSKIKEEDLLEYLKLEQERNKAVQESRTDMCKRIINAVQLSVILVAVIFAIYFLKEQPAILISILYLCAVLIGLWLYLWKKPRDK